MFEEKVMEKIEDSRLKIEDRRSGSKRGLARDRSVAICDPRTLIALLIIMMAGWPARGRAQQDWYYHTIHSNTLALQYGRTVKLTYANQASRTRQFKLSLYYIYDEFDMGEDRVKSDMYNIYLEFQYQLM